ncbi:hypothetical protein G9A89_020470 [Geosiphon pyriformis]|nr:hypothetical protein G9A89_020470 [Geosiphon pyriformis]
MQTLYPPQVFSQEIGDLAFLPSIDNSELNNIPGSSAETSELSVQTDPLQIASNNFFENTTPITSQNIENDGTLFAKANAGSYQAIDMETRNKIALYADFALCGIHSKPFRTTRVVYASKDFQVIAGKDVESSNIFYSFLGFTPAANIISDITLTNHPYDESSKVHKGFLNIFLKNEEALINIVSKEIREKTVSSLIMTGSDSGGVYAIFTALALKFRGESSSVKDVEVYTFGQPRIGDKAFAQLVTEKLIVRRVVHQSDPIPHRPQISQGYLHFDTEYWDKTIGTNGGEVFKCDGIKDQSRRLMGENPQCSASATGLASIEHEGPYLFKTVKDCDNSS